MEYSKFYEFNELKYLKGYELDEEDFIKLAENKTSTLESGQIALESFVKCYLTYKKVNNEKIDELDFENEANKSLLAEACVFGIEIDYEKLFNRMKDLPYEEIKLYFLLLRESISLCMLNEIGKKRIEIEYSLSLNENIAKKLDKFRAIMEKLFLIKDSENMKYLKLDVILDRYISDNLLNLQKNIISGNPFDVASIMLNIAEEEEV